MAGTDANFVTKLAQCHPASAYLLVPSAGSGKKGLGGVTRGRAPIPHLAATRHRRSNLASPKSASAREGGEAAGQPQHAFAVMHYAGEVWYDALGWRAKNADVAEPQHLELLAMSDHPLMPELLSAADAATSGDSPVNDAPAAATGGSARDAAAWRRAAKQLGGARRAQAALMGSAGERRRSSKTIGGQFVRQLSQLAATLSESECQYVRCIKPNAKAASGVWEGAYVERQLAHGGIFAAARAARHGFDHRLEHSFFVQMYGLLGGKPSRRAIIGDQSPTKSDTKTHVSEVCRMVLAKVEPPEGHRSPYQVGVTKVFLTSDAIEALDAMRFIRREVAALRVQRSARRVLSARSVHARVSAIVHVQSAWRVAIARHEVASRTAARLAAALQMAEEKRAEAAAMAAAALIEGARGMATIAAMDDEISEGRRELEGSSPSPSLSGASKVRARIPLGESTSPNSMPQKATPHAKSKSAMGGSALGGGMMTASPSFISPSHAHLTEAAAICTQIEQLHRRMSSAGDSQLSVMLARMQRLRAAHASAQTATGTSPRASPPGTADTLSGQLGLTTPSASINVSDEILSQARAALLVSRGQLPGLASPTSPHARSQLATDAANSLLGRTDAASDAAQSILAYQAALSLLKDIDTSPPIPPGSTLTALQPADKLEHALAAAPTRGRPASFLMVVLVPAVLLLAALLVPYTVQQDILQKWMPPPPPLPQPPLGLRERLMAEGGRWYSLEWRALAGEGEAALLRAELHKAAEERSLRIARRQRISAELAALAKAPRVYAWQPSWLALPPEWRDSASAPMLSRLQTKAWSFLDVLLPAPLPPQPPQPATIGRMVGWLFH